MKRLLPRLKIGSLLLGSFFTGMILLNLLFPYPFPPRLEGEPMHTIYVVDHGYHTGLILPGNHASIHWGDKLAFTSPALWYEFGWGDRTFYPDPNPSLAVTWNAMCAPSTSTLHICAIQKDPEVWAGSSRIRKLEVSTTALDALNNYVSATFEEQTKAPLTSTGKGIYGNSAFYSAKYQYHIFNNCNAWTAGGLRSMGLQTAFWTATPQAVFRFLPD